MARADDQASDDDAVAPLTAAEFRLSHRASLGLGIVFVLIGAWVCWESRNLTYYTRVGPGPGFFPFWLGLLLSVAAALSVVFAVRGGGAYERLLPAPGPLREMAMTLVLIAAFAVSVERLGFVLSMLPILTLLLVLRGCALVSTALPVALLFTFGVGWSFTRYLGTYLPPAPGGLLSVIGL